jgi:hypothetical protein
MGSHIDEPIFWSVLLVKGGHTEVGVLKEQPGSVAVRAVQVRCDSGAFRNVRTV